VRRLLAIFIVITVAGCGSGQATTSATPSVPALPGETVTTAQGTPSTRPQARPGTATVAVNAQYAGFVSALCRDFRSRNARAITAQLPFYQYNSGLRYGQLGGGEGSTGDPSLMGTWLSHSSVRCVLYTPGVAGHGALLTQGWSQPGGWGLLDLDTYSGHWKINDFTFGKQSDLVYAIHTANPVLQYRG